MTVELYFAPGACSFVPHIGLKIARVPALVTFVERVMAQAPVAVVLERERVKLDTYTTAA